MKVFEELRVILGQIYKKNLIVHLTHDTMVSMTHINPIQQAAHLVILDIENMAGSPNPTPAELVQIHDQLADVIDGYDDLPCIVACSHRAAPIVMFAFPKALRRLQSGPNGADMALLREMCEHRVMNRYAKVTLCSGDGIFTDEVAHLGWAGVEVTVVAHEGSLANRLRLAAARVVTLAPPDEFAPAAAMREAS